MKAVAYPGPFQVAVEKVPDTQMQESGDAIVRAKVLVPPPSKVGPESAVR